MLETNRPNQRPQLCRPGPTPHRLDNQKPPRELGEKKNKCVEEGEGIERLAPPRAKRMPPKPTPPRPTLARPEKPRKKSSRKPALRWLHKKMLVSKICPKSFSSRMCLGLWKSNSADKMTLDVGQA